MIYPEDKNKTLKPCRKTSLRGGTKNRPAVVLVLVLVALVVLTAVVYTLSARLGMQRRRQQYIIDYQTARYACDSALKYALATVEEMKLSLTERADEPDFSDIFAMSAQEYVDFLIDWVEQRAEQDEQDNTDNSLAKYTKRSKYKSRSIFDPNRSDPNSMDPNELSEYDEDFIDPNTLIVPGPYGPPWPYATEPVEFEIDRARITIEIEDENAKMPLTWAITTDKEVNRTAEAALEIFCEWMRMDRSQIEELSEQLADIGEKKQFKLELKPVTYSEKVKSTSGSRTISRRRSRSGRTRSRVIRQTRPALAHTTDFAKLLHSSIIDLESLGGPTTQTDRPNESVLKYLGLWGSQRVNINTAPRHVLEAAFTFGGDAQNIANEIILKRREKPFKDIEQLKETFYGYGFSDSIKKAGPYITTTSRFFTIKVTAVSGRAKCSSVATVIKEGKKAQKIAVITN